MPLVAIRSEVFTLGIRPGQIAAIDNIRAADLIPIDLMVIVPSPVWVEGTLTQAGGVAQGSDGNLYLANIDTAFINPVGDLSGVWTYLPPGGPGFNVDTPTAAQLAGLTREAVIETGVLATDLGGATQAAMIAAQQQLATLQAQMVAVLASLGTSGVPVGTGTVGFDGGGGFDDGDTFDADLSLTGTTGTGQTGPTQAQFDALQLVVSNLQIAAAQRTYDA